MLVPRKNTPMMAIYILGYKYATDQDVRYQINTSLTNLFILRQDCAIDRDVLPPAKLRH